MNKTLYLILILLSAFVYSQEKAKDSLEANTLEEIIVFGDNTQPNQKQRKPLASIDEYLQESDKVSMIRRGSYASEPLINSMTTERTLITIDGMRIFGACTDKMDPVTSYVEISNLEEANISSGKEGACHGSTIGGGIDLKINGGEFSSRGVDATVYGGYETNAQQKVAGTSVGYSGKSVYANGTLMYRDANNYKAGGNEEILYSQFTKYNLSSNVGFLLAADKTIEGSVIYDKAIDVGYPALPMDISSATALIGSVKFTYTPTEKLIDNWETKVYYNTITHIMDDTKRAFVPMHMDMPGWSDTFGFYSKTAVKLKKHTLIADFSSFYNKSLAEMTMYPNDPNEKSMYMFTWPDVATTYFAAYLEDVFSISERANIKVNANLASHTNQVKDKMGLESLQIFYPDMTASKARFLKTVSASYKYTHQGLKAKFGLAFGDRAPSVTEGYGFYLFNANDKYDYIGCPTLENESSLEASFSAGYSIKKAAVSIASSYFKIYNYIIGIPNPDFIAMTIGAKGVKVYRALSYANIFNAAFSASYQIMTPIKWKGKVTYNYGKDYAGENLPFISPVSYNTGFEVQKGKFIGDIMVEGNATQTQYSIMSGEDGTDAYALLNASAGYYFLFGNNKLNIKAGMENIFDKYYTNFSDWNNIPKMGRNMFVNIAISF